MKVNELMIGDWVNAHRSECVGDGGQYQEWEELGKVTHIYEDTAMLLFPTRVDGWEEMYAEDFEPIPLTAEILENNEFVDNKHVYPYPYYEYTNEEDKLKIGFAFPQGNKTSYKDPWVYIDSERVFIEHLPCMFVHQLQQILRLCGIEKEIKL